jgi:hypothetical protein
VNKFEEWEKGKFQKSKRRLQHYVSNVNCILSSVSLINDLIGDTNNTYNRKPSGLRAGRKLVNHRRHERWSSKQYNKSHSVTAMKANPLGGSCMSKGIVLEKMYVIYTVR